MAGALRRLAVIASSTLVLVAAGCGSHASGPITPCVAVPIVGSDQTVLSPPPPHIVRAVQRGQEMIVDLQIPRTPGACKPVAYIAAVASKVDYGNRSIQPGNNTGGYVRLHSDHVHVVLRPPVLRLPPYVAIASIASKNGVASKAVKRALPQRGDYCLRNHPETLCVIRAHYDALRCMRAEVPRANCTAWTYGSMRPFPVVPVKGASAAAVRESLREVLGKNTYNDVRLQELTCTPVLSCIATFAQASSEETLRIKYTLTGYEQKPGCWRTSRSDVLYPPPDRAESPLVPLVEQSPSWCLSWRKP